MDYFESVLTTLLEAENYWVRRSFKIELSRDDRRVINRPTSPRPEIDVLAFSFKENIVILFEAKSYLDSPGVRFPDLIKEYDLPEGQYKLFTCEKYRTIVFKQVKKQLIEVGMANEKTRVTLGLAAGKIHKNQTEELRHHLQIKKKWIFWSPEDIKCKVEHLAARSYENDPVVITAKILMRNNKTKK